MAQHLNLLDASLRPERSWLRASVVLALLVLLLLGVLGAGAGMRRVAAERQQAAQQSEAQLVALAATPAVQQDEREQREIVQLREQLAQARLLDQQLQQLPPADAAFRLLEALARAAGEDTWLTQAQWEAREPRLELQGQLLDPRRLPNYLRRLEQQPALRGQRFAQLKLVAQPADGTHQFQLRSAKEGKR